MAIESVLSQTYPNIELLIVDDGSTDITPTICQAYSKKDTRCQYIRQNNRGPAAARNSAIKLSKGSYICFLDADDVMAPNKVEMQLAAMQQDSAVDITYTALNLIDEKGQYLGEILSQDYPPDQFLLQMFFRNVIPGPNTYMAKRTCLEKNPYNEHFSVSEDYELMLRLAHQFRFKYIDIPLISYRRHSQNLSNNLADSRKAELRVLQEYSKEHIEELIRRCTLSESEKILMKGKIFFNMELINEALETLELLNTPLSLFYQGNCFLKLNMLDQATNCFDRSLNQDPSNPAAHNNLGVVYAMERNTALAKKSFQRALKLREGYLDPKINLANVDSKMPSNITWKELRPNLMRYSE